MSKAIKWGLVVGIPLILIFSFINMYNNFVRLNEMVATEHSNISVQLERRADLIPNLINTVKAYASHEEEIFTRVSEARQAMMNAGTIGQQAMANTQMTSALGRLFAVAEAYPDLKANENFIRLQDELAGTENRIAVVRRDYNTATRNFNAAIKVFPGVFFAPMFGFKDAEYFEASEGSQEVPVVNF